MDKLLILAYNEELYIKETILSNIDFFDEIIVVNDFSKDSTLQILNDLTKDYKNLKIINNPKNLGAGNSMNVGIRKALESDFDYLFKIDGDNQFRNTDIEKVKELVYENNSDFLKADRFWPEGIQGKIPKIRYFGNAFASFLIKFITSNANITDPLNGFFVFSHKSAILLKIPKIFSRYGYPFYINSFFYELAMKDKLKVHQIKNKVVYENETSYIKPTIMFLKLIKYSIRFYFYMIKEKLRYSKFQMSGLLDLVSLISLVISIVSISRSIGARYFEVDANQSAWFIISILFLVFFIFLNFGSRFLVRNVNKEIFKNL